MQKVESLNKVRKNLFTVSFSIFMIIDIMSNDCVTTGHFAGWVGSNTI